MDNCSTSYEHRAKWLQDAKYGIMCHYLADMAGQLTASQLDSESWNRRVADFDTGRFVQQVKQTGAGYVIFTLGQCSGYYCAPNETYDRLTGIYPSHCSSRDLITDLAVALQKISVPLIVYLPSAPPDNDKIACEKLAYSANTHSPDDRRMEQMQEMWQDIISDWSLRFGKNISGWWIDGCYFADVMYRHQDEPNFKSLAAVIRAGNPDSIIAFNPGVHMPLMSLTEYEDYTAGEVDGELPIDFDYVDFYRKPLKTYTKQAQTHILTPLGEWWGRGKPRFTDDLLVAYVRYLSLKQIPITLDIPISESGILSDEVIEQMKKVKTVIREKE